MNQLSNNQKSLLEIIGAIGGKPGITTIVKSAFLKQALYKNKINYSFIRWYYGPYSKEIQKDLDGLVEHGFLKKSIINGSICFEPIVQIKFSEDDSRLAKFIRRETISGIKPFLKKLYDAFDIHNREMGASIIFDERVHKTAQDFLNT